VRTNADDHLRVGGVVLENTTQWSMVVAASAGGRPVRSSIASSFPLTKVRSPITINVARSSEAPWPTSIAWVPDAGPASPLSRKGTCEASLLDE
jgi:hypothetical protein